MPAAGVCSSVLTCGVGGRLCAGAAGVHVRHSPRTPACRAALRNGVPSRQEQLSCRTMRGDVVLFALLVRCLPRVILPGVAYVT
jgi:hypothetical protein